MVNTRHEPLVRRPLVVLVTVYVAVAVATVVALVVLSAVHPAAATHEA